MSGKIPPRLAEELGLGASAAGNGHRPEGNGYRPEEPPRRALTDLGNAERLVDRHGDDLRYVYPWKKWLAWDNRRFRIDQSGEVVRRAKETVRAMYHEADPGGGGDVDAKLASHALKSQSRRATDAMISLAQSELPIPILPEDLDTDPWLLNVANGTLDLRTGELREHRREDRLTKVAPVEYDPDAKAPRFEEFLREVFDGDEDLISFVRRFAGYCLTGSTEERVFAILHGSGKNGKSTLVELLRDVLGGYAQNTSPETVLARRYEGVGNDVAALKGARFVSAAEVEQGRHLSEAKIKNLTGADTVTARFLHGEFFDFKPQFKLWLSTNNKPIIRGTDDAIWDRIRLIPFGQRFDGDRSDPKLPEKLREELPGVLAWMVRGCLEWQREGLGKAGRVEEATADYRLEMDTLADFIAERCVVHPRASAGATNLYNVYKEWCEEGGEKPESQTKFGLRLKDRGFEKKTVQTVTWLGIGLRSDRPDPDNPLPDEGEGANPLPDESPIDKRNTADPVEGVEGSRGFFHKIGPYPPHEDKTSDKGLQPSNPLLEESLTPRERRRLTPEEAKRVQCLLGDGWSAAAARAEVLGEGLEGLE